MKRTVMIVAAVFGLGIAGAASARLLLASPTPVPITQTAVAERQATFVIENMTCVTCPITVRRAMWRVDGVRLVSVDFDAKTATVDFDPSRATVSEIAAASTNAGYPAHTVEG